MIFVKLIVVLKSPMKKLLNSIYLIFFPLLFAFGQSASEAPQMNIVPNNGFEEFSGFPIGWFYKGKHFTSVVKYWSAATAASPDVFGHNVRVPLHWQEKDFGEQDPKQGKAMAGITVFGCDEGKPHCREYIQIQLIEPLVIGQEYEVEFWVSHLPRSLQVNNIGCYFSEEKIELSTDELLEFTPQINTSEIADGAKNKWVKIDGNFKAKTEASYLIIGNFYPDSLTTSRSICEDDLNYAYYYVDDVKVFKQDPILPVPIKEDDLSKVKIEEGKVIQLKNIFFETDMAELLPRSYTELKKLHQILLDFPNMVIEIRGHTDVRGGHDYNIDLSQRRAKAVVDYLNKRGIAANRTRFKGFGSTQPIADNDTPSGRQQNRRVEFIILQK